MSDAAPDLFRIIKNVLVDNVFLGLAVLADPASTRVSGVVRDNLSIERLLQEVDVFAANEPANQAVAAAIRDEFSVFRQSVQTIKAHRNRRIAHADAATRLDPAEQLDGVSRGDLDVVVAGAFSLMNRIEILLADSQTAYDQPILRGCGESVLDALRRSRRFLDLEQWLRTETFLGRSSEELRDELLAGFFDRR